MLTGKLIRTMELANGVTAFIHDTTRHYYGGYYHIRLLIHADITVSEGWFACSGDYNDAVKRLGASIRFTRLLEKMAVPENELDQVRRLLMNSFDLNVKPYLSRSDFSRRFALSEYAKVLKTHPSAFFQKISHV